MPEGTGLTPSACHRWTYSAGTTGLDLTWHVPVLHQLCFSQHLGRPRHGCWSEGLTALSGPVRPVHNDAFRSGGVVSVWRYSSALADGNPEEWVYMYCGVYEELECGSNIRCASGSACVEALVCHRGHRRGWYWDGICKKDGREHTRRGKFGGTRASANPSRTCDDHGEEFR